MNSTDQIPPSETDSQVAPQEPQSGQDLAPCLASRGNGFVARLPKALRDQLNQMMLDAVPYAVIIERLGDPASHLKPHHLTEWKKRGHQDWLLHQDWLADPPRHSTLATRHLFPNVATNAVSSCRLSSLPENGPRLTAINAGLLSVRQVRASNSVRNAAAFCQNSIRTAPARSRTVLTAASFSRRHPPASQHPPPPDAHATIRLSALG